jgi:hypothetical protein
MAYRRPAASDASGPRWRLAHRDLLSERGIPDEVADWDRRWGYLLLHGVDRPGTGWEPSWISPRQAARLLDGLLANLPTEDGYDLIRGLRRSSQDREH